MTDHLFVYGTLRTGAHPMHAALADAGRRIGLAWVRGRLLDLGWYPGLIDAGRGRVVGELWRLSNPDATLSHLDAYEGDEYERSRRPVQLDDGRPMTAWIYLYEARLPQGEPLGAGATVIASGDWLAHLRGREGGQGSQSSL